jgi:hypothetical protein
MKIAEKKTKESGGSHWPLQQKTNKGAIILSMEE